MNIRGKKVYNTLFRPEVMEALAVDEPEEDKRGRNPELIELRNEHLLSRFYYYRSWGMQGDKRATPAYDWIVKRLGAEFYLTESTVGQIIVNNDDIMQKIRIQKPTVKALREKYPFFNWV